MSSPVETNIYAWLTPSEKDALDQAIAADRAYADPDACPRGGNPDCGCSNCAGGRSVDPNDDYVPEYQRTWRPAS